MKVVGRPQPAASAVYCRRTHIEYLEEQIRPLQKKAEELSKENTEKGEYISKNLRKLSDFFSFFWLVFLPQSSYNVSL